MLQHALETARTLAISGDASGSASFDGSANATISATLANTGVWRPMVLQLKYLYLQLILGRITSAWCKPALTVTGDSGSETLIF